MTLYILPSGDAIDPATVKNVRIAPISCDLVIVNTTEGQFTIRNAKTASGAIRLRNRIVREINYIIARLETERQQKQLLETK